MLCKGARGRACFGRLLVSFSLGCFFVIAGCAANYRSWLHAPSWIPTEVGGNHIDCMVAVRRTETLNGLRGWILGGSEKKKVNENTEHSTYYY